MKKIAIDIVILPPENILEKCIELHNSCKLKRFQMSKNDFIPHISLTLMGIYEKDLDKIIKIISQININPFDISLTGISSRKKAEWIDICVDENLRKLHEHITKSTHPYFQTADNPKMLIEGEKTGWNESSKAWINTFYTEHSFEKYHPHITLGCYNLDESQIQFPISFKANKICIFQVGNSNTCRKLLWGKTF